MKPLLSTALSSLFSSALHFVGYYYLLTLYPTFAARYGDVSESLVGWVGSLSHFVTFLLTRKLPFSRCFIIRQQLLTPDQAAHRAALHS